MSFDTLVKEISELKEDIEFLKGIKNEMLEKEGRDADGLRAITNAINSSNEKLNELMKRNDIEVDGDDGESYI